MKGKDLRSISVWLDTALWKWRGKISEVFLCGWTQLCESDEERSQKYLCVVGHSSEVKKEDLGNTLKSRGKISEIPVWLDTALKWRGKISEMFLCGWTQLWTEEERSQKCFCVVRHSSELKRKDLRSIYVWLDKAKNIISIFLWLCRIEKSRGKISAVFWDTSWSRFRAPYGQRYWGWCHLWQGEWWRQWVKVSVCFEGGDNVILYLWQDSRGSVRLAYAHFCW